LLVLTNLSARRGASASGLLAFAASIHCCSSPATACSVPLLSFVCAATISDINATAHHTSVLFIDLLHSAFQICSRSCPQGRLPEQTVAIALLPPLRVREKDKRGLASEVCHPLCLRGADGSSGQIIFHKPSRSNRGAYEPCILALGEQ